MVWNRGEGVEWCGGEGWSGMEVRGGVEVREWSGGEGWCRGEGVVWR